MTDQLGYTALGLDDGEGGNVELHDAPTEGECRDWINGYTKYGNWGGYYGIAIIDPEGEWIAVFDAPSRRRYSGKSSIKKS